MPGAAGGDASLKKFITEQGLRLGFDKIGFAAPAALAREGEHLADFLAEKRHGNMAWLSSRSAERSDLQTYWPPVRTVVSLAMNYHTPAPETAAGTLRWSNYAWGDDYHKLIKKRLKALLLEVQKAYPNVSGRVCVDTAPVMEKVWAQRAGLGWQGKHTNLISRDYGSWLFLSELLLDVALPPDLPFEEDLCGSCTACLEACPTGALDEAYRIDARKCISYLTIEHREPFSAAQADMLGGWLYGCDICQEVCPWNKRFGRETTEAAFRPRPFVNWTRQQWDALTEEAWDRLLRGSAARRPGYRGLMRNVAAAKQVDTPEGTV